MKKKDYFHIYFVFIVISGISCHRENVFPENVTVTGHLTDSCTGIGIKGSIDLNKDDYHPTVLFARIKLIQTDDYGFYKIRFYAEKNKEYSLTFAPEYPSELNYYSSQRIGHIKRGDNINRDVRFKEEVWLEVTYKDINPYDPSTDSLYCIVTDNGAHTTHETIIAHGNWNYGTGVHLTDCFPLKVYLNWDATKNNITTHHSDSVICQFNGQNVYNLNY